MYGILSSTFVVATLASTVAAFDPPFIPLNWTTVYACAADTPSRVLAGVVTTQYADNTPATCIARCDAAGFLYAGVEYSNECHCGTGLVPPGPVVVPTYQCNLPCTGDSSLSCGGSFRIQIYKSPALVGSTTLQGCYLDTLASPAFASPVHHTFPTNLDLVGQCINYCEHLGYPSSGVENASDCQCSFGLAPGAQKVADSECNSLCPLPPGAGQQICGGFQRLLAYRFNGA